MDGDQLTLIGVLVVSLIGTTGLTGLLSGGIEIGARNRLRKRVEHALDLRDRFRPRTPEWEALSYAAQLESIRLAALSAVGLKRRLKLMITSFFGAALTYIVLGIVVLTGGNLEDRASLFGFGSGTRLQLGLTFAVSTAVLAIVFASILEGSLRRSREQFVAEVLAGHPVVAIARKFHG